MTDHMTLVAAEIAERTLIELLCMKWSGASSSKVSAAALAMHTEHAREYISALASAGLVILLAFPQPDHRP